MITDWMDIDCRANDSSEFVIVTIPKAMLLSYFDLMLLHIQITITHLYKIKIVSNHWLVIRQ